MIANDIPPIFVFTFQSACFSRVTPRPTPPCKCQAGNINPSWPRPRCFLSLTRSTSPSRISLQVQHSFKMHFSTQFLVSILLANIPHALGRPRGSLARAVPARRDKDLHERRQVTVPPSSTIANATSSGKRYDTRIWTVVRATKFATSIVTVTITTPPVASTSTGLATVHATTTSLAQSTKTPSREQKACPMEDEVFRLPSDFGKGFQFPLQRRKKERRIPRHLLEKRSTPQVFKPPSFGKIPVPLPARSTSSSPNTTENDEQGTKSKFHITLTPNPQFVGRQSSAQDGFQAMVHAFAKYGVPPTAAMERAMAMNPEYHNLTRRMSSSLLPFLVNI